VSSPMHEIPEWNVGEWQTAAQENGRAKPVAVAACIPADRRRPMSNPVRMAASRGTSLLPRPAQPTAVTYTGTRGISVHQPWDTDYAPGVAGHPVRQSAGRADHSCRPCECGGTGEQTFDATVDRIERVNTRLSRSSI
jgi:hypothetical protein